jgi:hypothetical protein
MPSTRATAVVIASPAPAAVTERPAPTRSIVPPPMSHTTSMSPKYVVADIMCATVSTMLTSDFTVFSSTSAA